MGEGGRRVEKRVARVGSATVFMGGMHRTGDGEVKFVSGVAVLLLFLGFQWAVDPGFDSHLAPWGLVGCAWVGDCRNFTEFS